MDRCLSCNQAPSAARGLCHRCYARHRTEGTLDEYPVRSRGGVPQVEGATYRQLDYWSRCGYLLPLRDYAGTGYRREWPASEVEVAQRLARLVNAGILPHVAIGVARGESEIAEGVRVVVDDA